MHTIERPMPPKKESVITPPRPVESLAFHELPPLPPQRMLAATNEFLVHLKSLVDSELKEHPDPQEKKQLERDVQTVILFFQPLIGGGKFGYNIKAAALTLEDLPENVFHALNRLAHKIPTIHDELLEQPSLRAETLLITAEPYHLPYVMVQKAMQALAQAPDTTTLGRVRAARVATITGGYAERQQPTHDKTLPFPVGEEDITPERMMISAAQTADALDAYIEHVPSDVRHDLRAVQSFLRGMASPEVARQKAADYEEDKSVRTFFLKRAKYLEHPQSLDLSVIPQSIIEAASRLSFVNPEMQAILLGHEVGKAHKLLMVQQEESSSIEHPHAFNPIALAALHTHRLHQEHMAGWDAIQKWDMLTDRPERDDIIATLSHAEYAAVAQKLGMFEKSETGFWRRAWDVLNTPIGTMWSRRQEKRKNRREQEIMRGWIEKIKTTESELRAIATVYGETVTYTREGVMGTQRRTIEKSGIYELACKYITFIIGEVEQHPQFKQQELVNALKQLIINIMSLMDKTGAEEMQAMPELDLKRGTYKGLSHWEYIVYRGKQAADFATLHPLWKLPDKETALEKQVHRINGHAEMVLQHATNKIIERHEHGNEMIAPMSMINTIAYARLCEQYADVMAPWDATLAKELRETARESRKIRPKEGWTKDRKNIFEMRETIRQSAMWMDAMLAPRGIASMKLDEPHDAHDDERLFAMLPPQEAPFTHHKKNDGRSAAKDILKRMNMGVPEGLKTEAFVLVFLGALREWQKYLKETNPEFAQDMEKLTIEVIQSDELKGELYHHRVDRAYKKFVRVIEAWLISQELQNKAEEQRKTFDIRGLAEMAEVVIKRLLGLGWRETRNIAQYATITQQILDVHKETPGPLYDLDVNQGGKIAHIIFMQIADVYEIIDPRKAQLIKEIARYALGNWFRFANVGRAPLEMGEKGVLVEDIEKLPEDWKQSFIDFHWRANSVERHTHYAPERECERFTDDGYEIHQFEVLPDGTEITLYRPTEETTREGALAKIVIVNNTGIRVLGDVNNDSGFVVNERGEVFVLPDGMMVTKDDGTAYSIGNREARQSMRPTYVLGNESMFESKNEVTTAHMAESVGSLRIPHLTIPPSWRLEITGRMIIAHDTALEIGETRVSSVSGEDQSQQSVQKHAVNTWHNINIPQYLGIQGFENRDVECAATNHLGAVLYFEKGSNKSLHVVVKGLGAEARYWQQWSERIDDKIKKIHLTPDGDIYMLKLAAPKHIVVTRRSMLKQDELEQELVRIKQSLPKDMRVMPDGTIYVAYTDRQGKPAITAFKGEPIEKEAEAG